MHIQNDIYYPFLFQIIITYFINQAGVWCIKSICALARCPTCSLTVCKFDRQLVNKVWSLCQCSFVNVLCMVDETWMTWKKRKKLWNFLKISEIFFFSFVLAFSTLLIWTKIFFFSHFSRFFLLSSIRRHFFFFGVTLSTCVLDV